MRDLLAFHDAALEEDTNQQKNISSLTGLSILKQPITTSFYNATVKIKSKFRRRDQLLNIPPLQMGIVAAHMTNLASHTYATQLSESNKKVVVESKELS